MNSIDSNTQIADYLKAGQADQAVALLSNMAVTFAKQQAFPEAEAYRDKILEIDSLALPTIVKLNETIEAEKSKAMTPKFRQLWAPFFKGLSPEEANAFFFALKDHTAESEQIVLAQGAPNDRLYLVRRGRLKVVYSDQDKDLLIYTLGRGDFFGHDTFFSLNVCTASVKALSETHMGYIERKTLDNLLSSHASLASNLENVCCAGMSTYDRIRQKGMDRRSFKRFKFNTPVSFQLTDHSNENAAQRSIRGELWDISKGGLSFYIQSKNSAQASRLIGRNISVRIKLNDMGKTRVIVVAGIVHGVQRQPLDEYSVHVKLHRKFSDSAIKTIHDIAVQNV